MNPLKLPSPTDSQKTVVIGGMEVRTSAPENHTGASSVIAALQQGLKDGSFRTLSESEDDKTD